jgi:hypothetical protein
VALHSAEIVRVNEASAEVLVSALKPGMYSLRVVTPLDEIARDASSKDVGRLLVGTLDGGDER